MAAMSRREFFTKTAADTAMAGLLAAAGGTILKANPLGLPIGSQTYPHRQMIKDGDFAGLLKTLKDIGVERIEHWAREIGMTQMFVATLGAGSNPTMDEVKRAADEYNAIAAVAARVGIQQGLHNEGFELSSVDGRRTYDILMELLDPKLVMFQFQMSTISYGFAADEYFTKYPGRFISMHVQDVDLNAASVGLGRGRGSQTSVGRGSIDWIKTFKAAKIGGVKNYFVEQNMELTKASVAALKAMNVT